MRISDWSSDVCSSDLCGAIAVKSGIISAFGINVIADVAAIRFHHIAAQTEGHGKAAGNLCDRTFAKNILMSRMSAFHGLEQAIAVRSEEHTSELKSLMRNTYAVFCLKKNTKRIKK